DGGRRSGFRVRLLLTNIRKADYSMLHGSALSVSPLQCRDGIGLCVCVCVCVCVCCLCLAIAPLLFNKRFLVEASSVCCGTVNNAGSSAECRPGHRHQKDHTANTTQ